MAMTCFDHNCISNIVGVFLSGAHESVAPYFAMIITDCIRFVNPFFHFSLPHIFAELFLCFAGHAKLAWIKEKGIFGKPHSAGRPHLLGIWPWPK